MGQYDKKGGRKQSPTVRRSPANEDEGWAAYRSWLGQVAGTRGRRVMADSSIYTLQGYKDWAYKVRKDWDSEPTK